MRMSEVKVHELSITNCLDYICTDLQKIEALAWHGTLPGLEEAHGRIQIEGGNHELLRLH